MDLSEKFGLGQGSLRLVVAIFDDGTTNHKYVRFDDSNNPSFLNILFSSSKSVKKFIILKAQDGIPMIDKVYDV